MTGRPAGVTQTADTRECGPELLRVQALSLIAESGRPVLRDVSLSLRAGEVLGIYGLMGAGRTELLECLLGMRPEMAGSISLGTEVLDRMDASKRISRGLAMVPEDRQVSGLVHSLSVMANMTLSSLGRFAGGLWLSPRSEALAAAGMVAELRIKAPRLSHNIESLSGGNQQKVVIAKCLLTQPRVLLLDEPTRGVDVGAKREIHAIVRRLASAGMGIVLVSSELEEVRATADRIIVMSRGRVTAQFHAAEASGDALALAASAAPELGELA
jgi:erythritol transport system ATP-binding protein